MNQQQVCTYFDHDDQKIKKICIDQQCSQNKRLCCQCINEKIHLHDQSLLIPVSIFQESIQQKVKEYQSIQDKILESRKSITSIIENIQRMIYQQYSSLNFYLEQAVNQLKITFDQLKQNIYTDETIIQGLKYINNKQIDQNKLQESWIQLQQELQNIDHKYSKQLIPIKRPIKIINKVDSPIKILNNHVSNNPNHTKFILTHENAEWIQAISISPCQKFLLSNGRDQKLIIWDLQNHNILYSIQYQQSISAHCFSNCSRILYLGDEQGKIHSKPLNWNNQSLILKTFEISHNSKIEFLLLMSVNLLSVSEECIKISMINPNQLLHTIELKIQIDAIEYAQQEKIIVMADIKNIMIWNARDDYQLLLQHQIPIVSCVKIQLLNQESQLAAAIDKTIIIYWMNFKQESLIEYAKIESNEEIINLIGQNMNYLTYITKNEILFVNFADTKNYNILRQIKEETKNSPKIRHNQNSNFIITVNDIDIVIYQSIN